MGSDTAGGLIAQCYEPGRFAELEERAVCGEGPIYYCLDVWLWDRAGMLSAAGLSDQTSFKFLSSISVLDIEATGLHSFLPSSPFQRSSLGTLQQASV